jgi:hypothetical protein
LPVALEFRGHQQLCRYKQQAQAEQEPEARRELLQLEGALVQVLPLWKEQVVPEGRLQEEKQQQARQAFPVPLLLCAFQSSPVELFALNLHKAAFLI